MILQSLYRLAEIEGLVEDPDYEYRPVSWVVRLGKNGSLSNIEDLRTNLNADSGRKPRWQGKQLSVPRQPIRTSGACAFFLVDKSEYVFGFDPADARSPDQLAERLSLFRDAVVASANATAEEDAAAVAAFLEQVAADPSPIRKQFAETPWAANDLFAFRVGRHEYVHELPAIRKYWKDSRSLDLADEKNAFHCLISGELVAEPGLFPLLKRVPGGTSSGVSLVSFNAKAFESYGLVGNQNAPISRAAAEQAGTALKRLLDEAYPDPTTPGATLPRRNLKIGADTIVCFWVATADHAVQQWLNSMGEVISGENEDNVHEAYRSIWQGRPAAVELVKSPEAFYALILSGAQGRAVVRDWIETSVGQTMGNLQLHFRDLKVVRSAKPKAGTAGSPAVPLKWLMSSLAAEGKTETLPAALEASFVRAALTGIGYPLQILQRALLRTRAEIGREGWFETLRRDARAALIKAVLNRRRRTDINAGQRYPEVNDAMNPSLESAGYSLGVLIAVMERLQALALGDINASLVDRFFSAASATPRSVFVRLLKNSLHHARKAQDLEENRDRAQAARCSRLIDSILNRFGVVGRQYPPKTDGLPPRLDLEQQGLFVLGYHQMRYWLWMSNEERKTWEAVHPDAPRAFRWLDKAKSADPTAAV